MNIIRQTPDGTKDILTVAPNRQVIDYLEQYDDKKDMETDIYVNNKKLEHDKDFEYVMREGDLLRIVYRPSVVGAIAAIASVLVLLVVSQTEDYTNGAGDTSSSSNNSVSGQTNTVRKYEGIPSICGRVWSYPDLIANSVPEWISNRKQVRELFLVTEGEVEVHQVRDGTTDIDDISESSYTIYGPDTYPSDLYRIQFNDSVSSEEIIAPDDASLVWSGSAVAVDKDIPITWDEINPENGLDVEVCFSSSSGIVISNLNTITFSVDRNLVFDFDYDSDTEEYTRNYNIKSTSLEIPFSLESGESLKVISRVDEETIVEIGSYTILSSSYNETSEEYTIITNEALINGSFSQYFVMIDRDRIAVNDNSIIDDLGLSSGSEIEISGYSGTFEIDGAYTGSAQFGGQLIRSDTTTLIMKSTESFGSNSRLTTSINKDNEGTINITGPYTMPTTAEQIWFNVAATSGLQSNSGGQISVKVTFYAQQIDENGDDVGSPVSQQVTLTGESTTVIGKTVKMTGLGGETYKVYAVRNTGTYTGSAIQDVFWQEVFTVNEYDGSTFGDVTVIDVTTKASTSSSSSSRQINLDVTRMIDGVSTTSFADYVNYYITTKGGYSDDFVNTEELYDIADSLSDDLKEFSYTFDDANLTLAQIVQAICNVVRVQAYRDGQQWRFTRDEAKDRTYMFNRRNLASGDNQAITLSTRQPQDYDGISLRYYNRNTEDYDNVYVKIDVDTQSFIVGEFGDNLKEIELDGCANYAQALNRANLEARKIVYQRKGVEDTALLDASNVSIGERVSWCDIFDGDIFDGEITGQSGNIYYTSEPFRPNDGVTYYALITDSEGEPMATVEVSQNEDEEKSFVADLENSVLIADNYEIQLGSRYIIGSVDDIDDTDYIVMGRGGDSGNGLISLELVQYSNNIYEMD